MLMHDAPSGIVSAPSGVPGCETAPESTASPRSGEKRPLRPRSGRRLRIGLVSALVIEAVTPVMPLRRRFARRGRKDHDHRSRMSPGAIRRDGQIVRCAPSRRRDATGSSGRRKLKGELRAMQNALAASTYNALRVQHRVSARRLPGVVVRSVNAHCRDSDLTARRGC